jgi:hypothetical protein
MDRLFEIICVLIEKIEDLVGQIARSQNGRVNSVISPTGIGDGSPQRLAARNDRRVGMIIHNNSAAILYIALASDRVDESYYSFAIQPQEHLLLDQESIKETYKEAVMGVWAEGAPATSVAMVTELFKEEA